jgi:V/A-type H+-transporting ATPase subunit I
LQDLQVLYDVEQTALTAARQKQKLAATEMCAVLEAWIPAEREERVTTALDRLDCAYETADPAPDEDAPILLKNNGYASNFEWVVGMYSYPRYGSFDPTFIMSIFYFLIFGLMFADVGYGLLLTLAGFLAPPLLGMKDGMRRTLNMFGYCGIACTLLGVVFGGWFGDLAYVIMTNYLGYESVEAAQAAVPFFNGVTLTLGGSPVSLNPLENPVAFLVISLGMGLIHMVAGMAVRFYVLWKDKQYVAAIFDVGAYWIIFAGIGCLLVNTTVAFAVLGVGVLMVVAMGGRAHRNIVMRLLMGLKGLYDLISYASDLLSYSRILALGLSAGVVAQVVNLIATMGGPTVPGFLLLVAVMLIGHALNMAINLLGAFVHTSRLQYLEFFGKFYEEGGTPFDPALPSEEYSTAESDAP